MGPNILPAIRMAFALMFKTKGQMVELAAMPEELFVETHDWIMGASEFFRGIAEIAENATARMIIAKSADIVRQESRDAFE